MKAYIAKKTILVHDWAPHPEAYFLDHILDTILNRLSNESREFK
jgi:hypothetical protein